nr:hypothetical protein [Paraburkholderia sp.]
MGNGATVASTDGNNSGVALGTGSYANGIAASMGYMSTASGSWSTALGPAATASATNAVAVGALATASTANSVALGNGATTAAAVANPNGVIGGTAYTYAGASPTGVVSVGKAGAERQLTNLAAGRVTSSSTDAVNGSQLYATNTQVSKNSTDITTLQSQITNIGGSTDAVLYDSSAHTSVTLGGTSSIAPVALHNVAAGLKATDAVNVSQLTSAGFSVDQTSGAVLNKAVTYDAGSIASGSPSITLDKGVGNSPYFRNGNRSDGLLPKGTIISNVANGIQDTDAASVGQVNDIVNGAFQNGSTMAMMAAKTNLLTATQGSGVDPAGLTSTFKTAAWYTQVKGIANASGSTGPTDLARANGAGSIAMGSNSQSDGLSSMALGLQTLAKSNDSVALGSGSVANEANTVSVGSDGTETRVVYDADNNATTVKSQANARRIVNMAAGQGDTDAVNVAQLKSVTNALGGGSTVNGDGSVTGPTYMVGGKTFTNAGDAFTNIDGRTTQNTTNITNLQAQMVDAVKYDSAAHTSVTLGTSGTPVALRNIAQGNVTNAFVAYDDASKGAVTLGGKDASTAVSIHNVANGIADADAINVAQLKAAGYGLASSVADALGGGSSVDGEGKIKPPTYNIGGNTYNNVGGALTNIDTRVSTLEGNVTQVMGQAANAVQYDSSAHDKVTLGGTGTSTTVKLTNLADGDISSASSTDAVTGGQLYATNKSIADGLPPAFIRSRRACADR